MSKESNRQPKINKRPKLPEDYHYKIEKLGNGLQYIVVDGTWIFLNRDNTDNRPHRTNWDFDGE